jgi:hypothetical protein
MRSTLAVTVAALAVLAAGCQSTDDTKTAAPAPTSVAPSKPAGNGVAALTAAEILKKAKAALVASKSFHVKGNTVEDGEKLAVDLKVSGKNVSGSLVTGKAKVELLAVGGKQFIRPNEAFWTISGAGKQAHTVAKVVGTRWVKVTPGDKDLADLFSLGDADTLLDPDGALTKGTEKVIAGVPAIGLVDGGKPGGTLWIATTGEPLPLKLDGTDGSGATFGEFGKTFAEIKQPAATEVFDMATLGK